MPLVEHPRSGIYLDDCHAPVFKVRLGLALAVLISMALWIILIFTAVAIYQRMRGGA